MHAERLMSDGLNELSLRAESDASAVATPDAHPGAALRAAREATGMHVAALAAMLKVPVGKLQALEAGRYEDLPNLTFARALAQSVCRVLKIDPKPILQGLPQVAQARLEPKDGTLSTPMPDRRPAVFSGGSSAPRNNKAWLLAGAVVVLAGVLWWVLPHRAAVSLDATESPPAAVTPAAESDTPAAPPELPKEVIAPSESRPGAEPGPAKLSNAPTAVAVPAAPAAPATPASAAAAPAAAAVVAPAPVAAPAADAARATPAVPASPSAPADAEGVLRLVAHQPTWVQVMAGGKQVAQRTLQAGESMAVPGNGTLSVTVGRVDEAEVYVRGQRFDMAPYTRNNVARFEVK